jgi:putative phosphoesterase
MSMTLPSKNTYELGLISDTHGYLPGSVLDLFRRVDVILHAGDIGSKEILRILEQVAPVVAVRGNMDWGRWADRLAEKESIRAGGQVIYLIHDVARFRMDSVDQPCIAVVNGHTHRPTVESKNGVLFVNPGSAGAPRFGKRAGVAILRISGSRASVDLLDIRD